VLSPKAYNQRSGLAIACPITSQTKGYPFEVPIPDGLTISGNVLCDQLKNIDWSIRRAVFADRAPDARLLDVRERLRPLLGY
jgi:mRNA interferase MazF